MFESHFSAHACSHTRTIRGIACLAGVKLFASFLITDAPGLEYNVRRAITSRAELMLRRVRRLVESNGPRRVASPEGNG
jgi:hypothetical protein